MTHECNESHAGTALPEKESSADQSDVDSKTSDLDSTEELARESAYPEDDYFDKNGGREKPLSGGSPDNGYRWQDSKKKQEDTND